MDRHARIFLLLMLTLLYEEASSRTIPKADGGEDELSPQRDAEAAREEVTIPNLGGKSLSEDAGGQQLAPRRLTEAVSNIFGRRSSDPFASHRSKKSKGCKRGGGGPPGILASSPLPFTPLGHNSPVSNMDTPPPFFPGGGPPPFPGGGPPTPAGSPPFRGGGPPAPAGGGFSRGGGGAPFAGGGAPFAGGGPPIPQGRPPLPQGGPLHRGGSFPTGGPRLPSTPLERSFSSPPMGRHAPGLGTFHVEHPNKRRRCSCRCHGGKYMTPEWEPEALTFPGFRADAHDFRPSVHALAQMSPTPAGWKGAATGSPDTGYTYPGRIELGEEWKEKMDKVFNGALA